MVLIVAKKSLNVTTAFFLLSNHMIYAIQYKCLCSSSVDLLPSVLCGSGVRAGPRVYVTLGGLCFCKRAGRAGGGMYLKALRLLIMWFPTNVLRPNARQSTTVRLRGGWRCSFSGNS